MTPDERIRQIEQLIADFEQSISYAERELTRKLLVAAESLIRNPASLPRVFNDWSPVWSAFITELASGILDVFDLNQVYFSTLEIDDSVLQASGEDLLQATGLLVTGSLVAGGLLSLLLNDTSIQRAVVDTVTTVRYSGQGASVLSELLQVQISGTTDRRGAIGSLMDSLPVQPHVDADRFIQRTVATRAGLQAAIYTGGLIDSSRPFCVARNGKTFLIEEIALFGTSFDKNTGYTDKTSGTFSGKPKTGYDPFTDLGGRGCRHHLSFISNREALRRRADLEDVDGNLKIKTT